MRYLVGFMFVLAGLVALPLSASAQDAEEDATSEPSLEEPTPSSEPAPGGASADSTPTQAVGDLRFRLVLLGRFGLGGTLRNKFEDPFVGGGQMTADFEPEATLGFDLRFEKPVAKYVTAGALLSNYWWSIKDVEDFGRQYALDIAPFVKPRYVFMAGSKEAELYVLVSFGGSLTRLDFDEEVYGGFNFGLSPGFQVFVAPDFALVFEVGYALSWFKVGGLADEKFTLGQAAIRVGFAAAF